jgi:uncharacterized protein (DUF1330 family)
MRGYQIVTLSMLAGAMLGGSVVQTLHAQSKPPVYYVAEIDVKEPDAYAKEYGAKAQAMIKAAGGRFLAADPHPIAFEGEQKSRVVIQVWDSIEKIKAWQDMPEWKELHKVGQKYATFTEFAVQGLPQ